MIGVIIPAHNEAGVIGRCLAAVTHGTQREELEVIVVANGCTDDTAAVARRFGSNVRVIETEIASKTHALNLGDAAVTGFPRFFVDADVVVTIESIRQIAGHLQNGRILAAAPSIRLNLEGASWAVRAFYELDQRMPSHQEGIGGSGVYALSAAGRARFDRFPQITADDAFVRRQFKPEERITVPEAWSLVTPPKTLDGIIKIKSRSHFGNYEISQKYPELTGNVGRSNRPALMKMLLMPHLWPHLLVYLYVKIAARLRAQARYRFGDHAKWERDESSREAAPQVRPEVQVGLGERRWHDVQTPGQAKGDLSILVVSYNTREMTLACLRSVHEQTQGIGFEVIVVDNASSDGSAEAIEKEFPGVRLIRSEENLGFARANNLAAKEARGEFLLLLNPDTVVLDGAVQKAVAFAEAHPEAGIVGGRTFFGDGSLNYGSCHGRPTPWSLLCMGVGLSSLLRQSTWFDPESLGPWKRDSVRRVDAVTGCFLLIRRGLWQRLSGFDESFFMYGEETDLCLRAAELGCSSVICPEATLIHYGGASERVRAEKMVRLFGAKARLFEKHWRPGTSWFGVAMLELWAFTRMAACGLLKLVQPSRQAAFEAWRDVWRRRGEFRVQQAAVQSAAVAEPAAGEEVGLAGKAGRSG